MIKSKTFETGNFYLASYLIAQGMELLTISKVDDRHCKFVFIDIDINKREQLVRDYNFAAQDASSVLVDARRLIQAIRSLKEKLHQQI